jgi:CheY-like chemotaxis protein
VATLVQGLLPMLQRLIGSNITIVDATSPLASPVMGDRGQIEQVVLNLVLNARDAMPEGGRITIRALDAGSQGTVPAARPGDHVLLEVADTGIGMDPETRRRAFEPFFTTKEAGSGTGLGLATVHGIVQQMGGWIETDTIQGHGTTFRLFLPQAGASAPSDDAQGLLTPSRRTETLLLIEDDDALRGLLARVLEGHGYRVIAVAGAEGALTVTDAEVHALDLVISDVLMPGMSGPEVVAELLAIRPDLRTLFITGQSDAVSELEGGILTGGRLLQKPFSPLDLLTKVRELLSVA